MGSAGCIAAAGTSHASSAVITPALVTLATDPTPSFIRRAGVRSGRPGQSAALLWLVVRVDVGEKDVPVLALDIRYRKRAAEGSVPHSNLPVQAYSNHGSRYAAEEPGVVVIDQNAGVI